MVSAETLTNQFLIAMPSLADPNFERTVTLICEHNADGALGLIINRPTDLSVGDVFQQLDLEQPEGDLAMQPVMHGGPVAQSRGFVLHGAEQRWESTLMLREGLALTTSRDIMEAMARGAGPQRSLFALGYAGWGAGQLEAELSDNAWLCVNSTNDLIFDTPYEQRWDAATRLLGIDPSRLSSEAGHS